MWSSPSRVECRKKAFLPSFRENTQDSKVTGFIIYPSLTPLASTQRTTSSVVSITRTLLVLLVKGAIIFTLLLHYRFPFYLQQMFFKWSLIN